MRGSPAILVRPAASARHSWVAAAAETRVRPGDRVSVAVVTADATPADPRRRRRVAAKVLGPCPGTAGVVDHGDGAYTLSFVPRVSGAHALSVMVGGAPVAASPLRLTPARRRPPAGRHRRHRGRRRPSGRRVHAARRRAAAARHWRG